MRFPWQREKPDVETLESAHRTAERACVDAQNDWPEVKKVARQSRVLNARNGFAEAIREAMGGRPT